MPSKPVNIGDLHFEKKGDAFNFLKDMLNRYSVGETVSKEDSKVLLSALNSHPDAKSKIGGGVSYFSIGRADYGTQCFWVNRTDGSTERFSYKSCIN